jgi:putative FmdB family regulatory protein
MPTYEYKCQACGYKFEKFQSIVAEPILVCPECSEKRVERLINGGSGLIFKGSGFYLTDYKHKNSSPAATKTEDKKSEDKKSD